MLQLFQHESTKAIFVLHHTSAASRKQAKRPNKAVQVKFAPVKPPSARELAWAEHKKNGTRYR